MTANLVSVIIPNYNHQQFLIKRIESVLQQSYPKLEIILLDDASSDNSAELLSSYQSNDKIKSIIINKQNSGSPFKQWLKGIKEATGDYVWIAESDDYADPDFLSYSVQQLDNNPTVGMTFCESFEVDSENDIIGRSYTEIQTDGADVTVFEGKDFCQQYLSQRNTIANVSAVLFRKATISTTDPFFSHMSMLGDWYLYLCLLQDNKIAHIGKQLNYFRQHKYTTRMNRSDSRWFQLLGEISSVANYLRANSYLSLPQSTELIETYHESLNYFLNLDISNLLDNKFTDICIYGAGTLGKLTLDTLKQTESSINCAYFIDRNADYLDSVEEIPVISITEYLKKGLELPIFIASVAYYKDIKNILSNHGIEDKVIN